MSEFIRFLGIIRKLAKKIEYSDMFRQRVKAYGDRSLLLVVEDKRGNNFCHIMVSPEGLKINPINKEATLMVKGPMDVFIDILYRKYTAMYAIAHRWLKVHSETPEGPFYHLAVISGYLNEMAEVLWGE